MDSVAATAAVSALVGLGLLGGLTVLLDPPLVAIEDAPRWAGQRICVQGLLGSVGTHAWSLSQDDSRLLGDGPLPSAAVPGDRIEACGRVDDGRASLALRVARVEDSRILSSWADMSVWIGDLAMRPWDWVGMRVATQGTVIDRGPGTALADGPWSLTVTGLRSWAVGSAVLVEGDVVYEDSTNAFRLKASGAYAP